MEAPSRPPRKIDTPAPPSRISQNTTVSKVTGVVHCMKTITNEDQQLLLAVALGIEL